MLREAVDLARTYGLQRVLTDAHPALGAWLDQITRTGDGPEVAGSTVVLVRPSPRETSRPQTAASIALTPKEHQVLELLARNLSNKEIASPLEWVKRPSSGTSRICSRS